MLRKLFGTKEFYKRLLILTIPIVIQNGITNFVNMLDNVMVGQVGTVQMTGVSVSNQLVYIFNLCVFGAVSGAGIFGAQFFGKGDHVGVKYILRFKMILCTLLSVLCIAVFLFWGDPLIRLYLQGEGSAEDIAASFRYAKEYLSIMLIGLLPYALVQSYASSLRETGRAVVPMAAGLSAVFINLVLNYILIYGKFGFPALGVSGAAIATVVSRFAELLIVALWTHLDKVKNQMFVGLYKGFKVPLSLCKTVFIKSLPLIANETLWAMGLAFVNQCYSVRGLDVVGAINISQTFFNVFAVMFLSLGTAAGILLGQQLGSGETESVKTVAHHAMVFSVLVSITIGIVYFLSAMVIPKAYNTTDEVRMLATGLMQITALTFPLQAYSHVAYYALRSGGKTYITIPFDSAFVWCVNATVAYLLSYHTAINILLVYLIVRLLDFIKCVMGYVFVNKDFWIKSVVSK